MSRHFTFAGSPVAWALFALALFSSLSFADEPPATRAQALRMQVEALRDRAEQLRGSGQFDQAAGLLQQADKLLAQIEEPAAPAQPAPPTASKPRRDRLAGPRGRIEEMRQLAAKLEAAGRSDEAARMYADAESIANRYAQQWQVELAVMQEQVGRLRSENEEAAAKKLEEAIQQRTEEMRRLDESRAIRPRVTPVPNEQRTLILRRIDQLQQAQANLRAANQPELADQVGREISQLQLRLPPASADTDGDHELATLRAEVQSLRKELAALKAALDQQRAAALKPDAEKK